MQHFDKIPVALRLFEEVRVPYPQVVHKGGGNFRTADESEWKIEGLTALSIPP